MKELTLKFQFYFNENFLNFERMPKIQMPKIRFKSIVQKFKNFKRHESNKTRIFEF